MQHATEYLTFETPNRRDYLNITPQVEEVVRCSGIQHGLVLVNPMQWPPSPPPSTSTTMRAG